MNLLKECVGLYVESNFVKEAVINLQAEAVGLNLLEKGCETESP